MATLTDTSVRDLNERLISVTEHLTAIEATVSALALALGNESGASKHGSDVAKSLRDFVSPQLRAEISKLTALIASHQSKRF